MANNWGILYYIADGRSYGECTETELASPEGLAAKGLAFKRLADISDRDHAFNESTHQWDATARDVALKPKK